MNNYPHLYIKSLLEEVKKLNEEMTLSHTGIVKLQLMTGCKMFSNEVSDLYKKIEDMSLEIEQLNQEIINTFNNMENEK